MFVIASLLIGITIYVCVVQTSAFARLCKYVARELAREPGEYKPKATVILPCKGLDPGFKENVQKLIDQDYPEFEIIFAVADKSDPAFEPLSELAAASTRRRAQVVVAGIDPKRAQKLTNQLCALERLSPESEVIVFVDSDVIARDDFLTRLIDPLSEQQVGVTTGYRFYIASPTNWPGMLRSLWNRLTAWEMANPRFAFAWGGAMAIRRDIFEKAGVAKHWDQSADDDLSLTTAIKALGLRVHFVPQCLVASDGDADVAEIFEWTNRQLILTKVYYPELWRRAIVRAFGMLAWLLMMVVSIAAWAATNDSQWGIAVAAGASLLPVEIYYLLKARRLWNKVLSDRTAYLSNSLIPSIAAIPLAHFVLPWLTLYSLLTNRIRWRGVVYELRRPDEILVVSTS
jgi:Glycosyltransferases, probably involved in cell wall biogenesis